MSTVKKTCRKCGNYGPTDPSVPECPACGRKKKSLNLEVMPEEKVQELVDTSKTLGIPPQYIGNSWSKTVFWRNNSSRRNKYLEEFVRKLDMLHDVFADGRLPPKGCMIIAPSTYSKVTWAYSCMNHALKNGFTVAPMLDTLEANRLVVLASQKDLRYKLYNTFDYDSYISADVLFLTVTKTEQRKAAHGVIREIIDKRSRQGLVTFVLSEYSVEEISAWDDSGMFRRMLDQFENENPKKVLATITYREAFN